MDQFKPQQTCVWQTRVCAAAIALLSVSVPMIQAASANQETALQLEVLINGQPTDLIAAFWLQPDGTMQTTVGEMRELGLKAPESQPPDSHIALNDIAGLSFNYNQEKQTIDIQTGDQNRVARTIDASAPVDTGSASAGFGMVTNYSFFAAVASRKEEKKYKVFVFDGASATLDHRVFTPVGSLSNTGIVGNTIYNDRNWLRLDSNWSTSNTKWLLTGTAGDLISAGLPWTRPIRIAGVQLRRNFALRPDLVTMPLPAIQGSAAVPSTVDVFVNNVKTYSQDVPEGPFVISNIPVVSGAGTARVVVNEISGRQLESSLPFYAESSLLAPGLFDFSAELGFARRDYGLESFSYDDQIIGSGSVRYGALDWLTFEAHAEASTNFVNGGLGVTASIASLATLSTAVSYSRFEKDDGWQVYGELQTKLGNTNISASTLRSFGRYADLGIITSEDPYLAFGNQIRSLDRLGLGFGFPEDWGSMGLSGLHLEQDDKRDSYIISASYGRNLFDRMNLQLSAFTELGDDTSHGFFANVSFPLGDWGSGSAGGSAGSNGWTAHVDASKPFNNETGSYGWRVQASEGQADNLQASASYVHEYGYAEANIAKIGEAVQGTASWEGSLAVIDSSIFATRRIDDSFAVVDVGEADVDVYYENRVQGRTGRSGKIIVPGLRAYQKNKLAVEPDDLPLGANVLQTSKEVWPASKSGIVVNFDVEKTYASAIVVFRDKDGKLIAPGTEGKLEGSDEGFVVGYDGQAYINNLQDNNVASLRLPTGTCLAHFSFQPAQESQNVIGSVECQ